VTSLAVVAFCTSSVTPGRPFCDEKTRWTTLPSTTVATSEIRLSALGTAQGSSAPTNGDVAVPLPLPYDDELVDGSAAELPLAVTAAAFEFTEPGATGASIGALATAVDELTMLEVVLPPVDVAPVVLPVDVEPAL
jgi:hypothetical protein